MAPNAAIILLLLLFFRRLIIFSVPLEYKLWSANILSASQTAK